MGSRPTTLSLPKELQTHQKAPSRGNRNQASKKETVDVNADLLDMSVEAVKHRCIHLGLSGDGSLQTTSPPYALSHDLLFITNHVIYVKAK